jgi:hypothetical protein
VGQAYRIIAAYSETLSDLVNSKLRNETPAQFSRSHGPPSPQGGRLLLAVTHHASLSLSHPPLTLNLNLRHYRIGGSGSVWI